ncbi:MAG: ABC transporter ATP-binding protein [Anaerolineae bacterium]|nr:ABC transporter ATP-binding protein [Anaerolineae bacterium]
MHVYEIANLTKRYAEQGEAANDDISLTIEQGEIFGLLGDNGAGKSTLIKQMANLLRPTHGSITLFGKPLNSDALYTPGNIGYMPQSGLALNMLTVRECLYFTSHLRGLSRPDARAERDRLIAQWDLGRIRDRATSKLSGGQKRLVLMATSAAASPPVLLLDEPTNDLDPQHRLLVWDTLRTINRERGTTIIFITHNAIEAEKIIQRVGIMQHGRLLAVGRPGALKAELNQQLRLDISFDPAQPPVLPVDSHNRRHEIASGRWQLLIERDQASAYLDALNAAPGLEDFRLSTATLEDLYFSLAR